VHETHRPAPDCRPLNVDQPVRHPSLLQAVEGVIQQRAFVQPVDPVDDLLVVQALCKPQIIMASNLLTQAFGQVFA
jgi:hypothetical protein